MRCGKCAAIFDGVAGLIEDDAERKLALEPSPQLGLFDPRSGDAAEEEVLPSFLAEKPQPSRWALGLWLLLGIVALGALGAQVYRLRSELTALVPELRPALEAGCRFARCAVELPRRPEMIRIVSHDMQDDSARQVYVLHALLRNLGRFPQQYPQLELTLTEAGKPVARRVLGPGEYLDPPAAPRQVAGIEAGGEEPVRVYLDARGVRASGYELCIFPNDCMKKAEK